MTIQEADKHFIHTYNRSVVFTKGEGMYLYDDQGKKYLDMGAGIAVSALGYSNEEFKQALKDQIDDLIHEVELRAAKNERVLVTTLTKKMAEDLTDIFYKQWSRGDRGRN